MQSMRQPRLHTALSFTLSLSGTEVLKMATQRIARIETTGGGFHFTFFLFTATPFSLKNGNLFFLFFFLFLLYMATLFPPLFFRFICYFLNAYLIHVRIQKIFLNAYVNHVYSKNILECIRESRMHSKIWSGFVKSSSQYTSLLSEKGVVQ